MRLRKYRGNLQGYNMLNKKIIMSSWSFHYLTIGISDPLKVRTDVLFIHAAVIRDRVTMTGILSIKLIHYKLIVLIRAL